jgi:hypothetical protein
MRGFLLTINVIYYIKPLIIKMVFAKLKLYNNRFKIYLYWLLPSTFSVYFIHPFRYEIFRKFRFNNSNFRDP